LQDEAGDKKMDGRSAVPKQKQKSMSRTKERRQRRLVSRNVDTREQATIYLYHKFDNFANDGLI
jgi:hypothetical protein